MAIDPVLGIVKLSILYLPRLEKDAFTTSGKKLRVEEGTTPNSEQLALRPVAIATVSAKSLKASASINHVLVANFPSPNETDPSRN